MKTLTGLLILISSITCAQVLKYDDKIIPSKVVNMTTKTTFTEEVGDTAIILKRKDGKRYVFTVSELIETSKVTIPGLSYSSMQGLIRNTNDLGGVNSGEWVIYTTPLTGKKQITFEYARLWTGSGQFEIRENNSTGKILATVTAPNSTAWNVYRTLVVPITASTATAFCIVFKADGMNTKSLTIE